MISIRRPPMKNTSSDTRILSTRKIADNIRAQISYLDEMIKKTARRLEGTNGIPDGTIKINKHNKTYQYYLKTPDTSRHKYVHVNEKPLIQKIVQKQYDEKMLGWMNNARKNLNRCAGSLEALDILDIYNSMGNGRKELTVPVAMTNEMYTDFWMKKYEDCKNQKYGTGPFQTIRGEFVRSKSEKILADTFNSLNIPYQYEPEIKLKNDMVFHPDFVLLNIKQRRTILWEHLGMISDADYAIKSLSKIRIYESNDILLGRDLIITAESAEKPISTQEIEAKLKAFVLNQ